MKRYLKFLPIVLILGLALFLRIYKIQELFNYAHDNDLASWIIKDIVVNHHFRLIGQQTSVLGVFIGGLFYYMQIPFYLLGKMDPFYAVYLSMSLGVFSVFSFYYVLKKIFSEKVGLIGALVYAVCQLIVFLDRDVYPTMPVMLWTIWYLYDLYLINKGNQKQGFILFGVLVALIWHMNIALYILTPLAFLSWILSNKRIQWKYLLVGLAFMIVLSAPLIVFEIRHGFQQVVAVVSSLTTQNNLLPETSVGFAKLDRVMQLVEKNTSYLFFPSLSKVPIRLTLILLTGAFLALSLAKKIPKPFSLIFLCWQLLYIVFFSTNSLNISEYYLSGMNIVWVIIATVALGVLLKKKLFKWLAIAIIVLYSLWNIYLDISYPNSRNGYTEKKAIVSFIKEDSLKHGYPCISISYITNPGYNLGYRYFFYLVDMHVNQPNSGSPVYTIVFPLSLVNKFDERFGSLGLIFPEYSKYNKKDVDKSCQGQNANLTDPMFGYTE